MKRLTSWLRCYTGALRVGFHAGWNAFCFVRRHELLHRKWGRLADRMNYASIEDLLRDSSVADLLRDSSLDKSGEED